MLAAIWYHYLFAFFFAFMAIVLMGVILLQRGRGVGLAGAFGGAGGNTAFGAKTGDFLTWATIVVAVLFLIYTAILNHVFVPHSTTIGATIAPVGESGGPAPVQGQPVPLQPSEAPPGFVPPQPVQPANPAPVNPAPAPAPAPVTPPADKPAEPGSGGGR